MRTLALVEFVTLDGVMQGLGSPEEDTDGGFTEGGWGVTYAEAVNISLAELNETTAYLFGRKTYEKMAAFWPSQPDSNPMAAHLNSTPKYVATRTLTDLAWRGSHLLADGLDEAVRRLKNAGRGTIVVLGSGVLSHELLIHDHVDEVRLFVHPLLLGTGKRLFRQLPSPRPLRLIESTSTSLGSLALRYAIEH